MAVLQLLGLFQHMENDKNVTIPFEVPFDLYKDPNQDFALDPRPPFERKLILGSSPEYQLKAVWKLILTSRLST